MSFIESTIILTFFINVLCCQVLSLDAANLKLEQKIKEYYESRSPTCRIDLSKYYSIMEDLEKQVKQQPSTIIKIEILPKLLTKLLCVSFLCASDFS